MVVDALCAAAVLRGAHVFAPGIMGLPTSELIDFKFCHHIIFLLGFFCGAASSYLDVWLSDNMSM